MKCARCKGTGDGGPAFVHYADGVCRHEEKTRCSDCRGTGEVSDEYPRRLQAGEQFRTRRQWLDLSLREAARRVGATPAEVSAVEHGRGDMPAHWMQAIEPPRIRKEPA